MKYVEWTDLKGQIAHMDAGGRGQNRDPRTCAHCCASLFAYANRNGKTYINAWLCNHCGAEQSPPPPFKQNVGDER